MNNFTRFLSNLGFGHIITAKFVYFCGPTLAILTIALLM